MVLMKMASQSDIDALKASLSFVRAPSRAVEVVRGGGSGASSRTHCAGDEGDARDVENLACVSNR